MSEDNIAREYQGNIVSSKHLYSWMATVFSMPAELEVGERPVQKRRARLFTLKGS